MHLSNMLCYDGGKINGGVARAYEAQINASRDDNELFLSPRYYSPDI